MRSHLSVLLASLALSVPVHVVAADAPKALTVKVEGITDGEPVPVKNAVCRPTIIGKSDTKGKNLRPAIKWSAVPKLTKSIAVFMMDPDVPVDFSDAGKDGVIIARDAARQNFFHWAVVNVPPLTGSLPGAKPGETLKVGTELANDMGKNKYVPSEGAYGGPCPPWNDARLHHYHFIVLALGEEAGVNTTEDAKAAYSRLIDSPHVLAKGASVGTYTLNPKMRH
ncbi:MAG: YbhB/YbcL family Raf kinase inhibitor-like protein [Rickettsiales bacterium]